MNLKCVGSVHTAQLVVSYFGKMFELVYDEARLS